MRKLIVFNLVTLDGYFSGPNGEIDWHQVDEEFFQFATEQLENIGALLFGRVTYEGMASYWPTPAAQESDPVTADQMNRIEKYVFSTTLDKADWNNTTLVKASAADEVAKLKAQPGKDLFIFGSADLASFLLKRGLVDEYRLIVVPVALGEGKTLFPDMAQPVQFSLLHTRTFRNGNVLLIYQPENAAR
jgi:dihydrofolate reductase